ncbi:MAG: DUF1572 family protein [Bacteroidetes bacterium]|nr:DUF1572 family protein [Bacteroidota bacterium]
MEWFIEVFERDLQQLKAELEMYEDESKLWIIDKDINNSAGNLALHLIGNLKHFIGAVMGETDYKRDRPAEFADKDIPRSELVQGIDETIELINTVFTDLDPEELNKTFPMDVLRPNMDTGFFMIHLAAHLNYHLGQVNYHRRLLG